MIKTSKGDWLLVKQKESHEWNTRIFLVLDGDKPVCIEHDGSYISWNIYILTVPSLCHMKPGPNK